MAENRKCNIVKVGDNRYSPGGLFPAFHLLPCYECLTHGAVWHTKKEVSPKCPVAIGRLAMPVSRHKKGVHGRSG
jgi:hypothetical protein